MKNKRPSVVFFQRKSRAIGNYSVEFIFEDVRKRLSSKISSKVVYSKFESNGLFKRLYNVLEAFLSQGQVNHVTGDINYVGLLLSKKKTIHTILDCVFLKGTTGLKQKILKYFWLTIPIKKSKYIIAISNATKQEILQHQKCDPNKIVVIPVAISNLFVKSQKEFNKVCPTILQLGTAPNKNVLNLLKAVVGLNCHLNIIGVKHQYLIDFMDSNKISYTYEHGLSNEDIVERYKQCDIVSLVSTYEGFGMPILEGQAIGRAVITSNIYSMPEVGGDACHYVDPQSIDDINQGIVKLIMNEKYRNQLIERGFNNIKKFDPELIAQMYFDLYDSI
jgi:glycosyltransferase involved in cell wall biosynthesis